MFVQVHPESGDSVTIEGKKGVVGMSINSEWSVLFEDGTSGTFPPFCIKYENVTRLRDLLDGAMRRHSVLTS
jgi:hypothetical protein